MAQTRSETIRRLESLHLRDAKDEDIKLVKEMSCDDLLRASSSLDLCAVAESMRRLRVALHTEEKAIKWLTLVLVILTAFVAFLTAVLLGLGILALLHFV